MARINLLPWREELRKERQQLFYIHSGIAAGMGLVAVLLANQYINGLSSIQRERNDYLRGEITKVEAEIKEIASLQEEKDRLLKRTEVIEQLQQTRAISVHLFDEMVNATPPGVYLLSLVEKGDQLEIKGVAESSGAVSDFMRRIDASPYMTNPKLLIIENKDRGREKRREFTLQAKVTSPSLKKAEDEAEAGGAQP